MSRIEQDAPPTEPPGSTRAPVVGLVTTAGAGDATAGQILRAYYHGHDVIVTAHTDDDLEGLQFARQLGATVLVPDEDERPLDLRERLASAARTEGYPGLLYHDDVTEPIHFERSLYALQEATTYAVDAQPVRTLDPNPTVLVAIPAYNEAETIDEVVTAAQTYADAVLVVDDGSTDETADRARTAGATVVRHRINQGYGAALQTAFQEANQCDAEYLVVLDGDGQHDPADIPKFVDAHDEDGAAIVVGSRFGDGAGTDLPRYRRFGLAVMNLLTNLSMGVVRSRSRVRDTQCGYRSYRSDIVESLATNETLDRRMGASTDILHHAHIHDFPIAEVETTVDYEVDNANSHNPLYHGVILVMNLVETIERERPIMFLGIPGFLSTFVGLGFGYWTVQNYIQTLTFPTGLALASVFFTLAGIFITFTSIILHALNTQFQ